MTTWRTDATGVLLANGEVLVFGGQSGDFVETPHAVGNASSSAELYDPATRSWTRMGGMSTGRFLATGTLLADRAGEPDERHRHRAGRRPADGHRGRGRLAVRRRSHGSSGGQSAGGRRRP